MTIKLLVQNVWPHVPNTSAHYGWYCMAAIKTPNTDIWLSITRSPPAVLSLPHCLTSWLSLRALSLYWPDGRCKKKKEEKRVVWMCSVLLQSKSNCIICKYTTNYNNSYLFADRNIFQYFTNIEISISNLYNTAKCFPCAMEIPQRITIPKYSCTAFNTKNDVTFNTYSYSSYSNEVR